MVVNNNHLYAIPLLVSDAFQTSIQSAPGTIVYNDDGQYNHLIRSIGYKGI
jgi:hypothetical protein